MVDERLTHDGAQPEKTTDTMTEEDIIDLEITADRKKAKQKLVMGIALIAALFCVFAAVGLLLEETITLSVMGKKGFYSSLNAKGSPNANAIVKTFENFSSAKTYNNSVKFTLDEAKMNQLTGIDSSYFSYMNRLELKAKSGYNNARDKYSLDLTVNEKGNPLINVKGYVKKDFAAISVPQLFSEYVYAGSGEDTKQLFKFAESMLSGQSKQGKITNDEINRLIVDVTEAFNSAVPDECLTIEQYTPDHKYGVNDAKAFLVSMDSAQLQTALLNVVDTLENHSVFKKAIDQIKDNSDLGSYIAGESDSGQLDFIKNLDKHIKRYIDDARDTIKACTDPGSETYLKSIKFYTVFTGNGIVTGKVIGRDFNITIINGGKQSDIKLFYIDRLNGLSGIIEAFAEIKTEGEQDKKFSLSASYSVKDFDIVGVVDISAATGGTVDFHGTIDFKFDIKNTCNMGIYYGTYKVNVDGLDYNLQLNIKDVRSIDYYTFTLFEKAEPVGEVQIGLSYDTANPFELPEIGKQASRDFGSLSPLDKIEIFANAKKLINSDDVLKEIFGELLAKLTETYAPEDSGGQ